MNRIKKEFKPINIVHKKTVFKKKGLLGWDLEPV